MKADSLAIRGHNHENPKERPIWQSPAPSGGLSRHRANGGRSKHSITLERICAYSSAWLCFNGPFSTAEPDSLEVDDAGWRIRAIYAFQPTRRDAIKYGHFFFGYSNFRQERCYRSLGWRQRANQLVASHRLLVSNSSLSDGFDAQEPLIFRGRRRNGFLLRLTRCNKFAFLYEDRFLWDQPVLDQFQQLQFYPSHLHADHIRSLR